MWTPNVKKIPVLDSSINVVCYEDKTGKERKLLISKDKRINNINRALDMTFHRYGSS